MKFVVIFVNDAVVYGVLCIIMLHAVDAVVCQVCPVCAVLPSGDPNHMTDDLAAHVALVHRLTTTADFISLLMRTCLLISTSGLCRHNLFVLIMRLLLLLVLRLKLFTAFLSRDKAFTMHPLLSLPFTCNVVVI